MATDFDIAGGRLSVSGSIFVGTVIRMDDRDAELLPAPNAALVGATGTAVGGKNQDDGNLNFAKGDAVSRALKGTPRSGVPARRIWVRRADQGLARLRTDRRRSPLRQPG
jgi:hypothetical protein